MNRENIEDTKAYLRGLMHQNHAQQRSLLPENDPEFTKFLETLGQEFMLHPHELGTALIELIPEVKKNYPHEDSQSMILNAYMHIFGQQCAWAINLCRYKDFVYDDIAKVCADTRGNGSKASLTLQLMQNVCHTIQTASRILRPIMKHYLQTSDAIRRITEGEDWKDEES